MDTDAAIDLDQSQERIGKALDRARLGEDRDLMGRVRDAGERCVRQVFGAIRLTALHDLDNAVFEKPLADLHASLSELSELLGGVHLVAVEGQVYINDVRVRLDERLDTAGQLQRELARHDVGGLSFHAVPDVAALKVLVAALGGPPAAGSPRAALRAHLRANGLDLLDLVGTFRFRITGEAVERRAIDVQRTRERATALVDATVDALGSARMPNPLPVRRAVTELLEGDPTAALMEASGARGSAFSQHTLRVSMLALMVGRALGLGQEALQDLGVAAMFHDVGYAAREGATRATADAPAEPGFAPPFERHGAAGARLLLRQRGFHESKIHRALAALQHHRRCDDPRGRPTLFARILRVCEAYDALTVLGPAVRSPPDALAALQLARAGRFDPVVVQALVNALGRYPPGTRLLLSDGREVVVVSTPTSPRDFSRPRCALVRWGGRHRAREARAHRPSLRHRVGRRGGGLTRLTTRGVRSAGRPRSPGVSGGRRWGARSRSGRAPGWARPPRDPRPPSRR